jgi:hypothetical protein
MISYIVNHYSILGTYPNIHCKKLATIMMGLAY